MSSFASEKRNTDTLGKRRALGRRLLGAAVALVGAAHAAAVGLYLMPDSPLRRLFAFSSEEYVDRFWSQNWHLFSPAPPTSSTVLHVRCSQGDEATPWLDVSSGIIEEAFAHPLSPYPKLRYVYNAVHDQLLQGVKTYVEEACGARDLPESRKGELASCGERVAADATRFIVRTAPYAMAARFGYDACRQSLPPEARLGPVRIELRLVNQFVFPFSQRAEIGTRRFARAEFFDFPSATWDPDKGGRLL